MGQAPWSEQGPSGAGLEFQPCSFLPAPPGQVASPLSACFLTSDTGIATDPPSQPHCNVLEQCLAQGKALPNLPTRPHCQAHHRRITDPDPPGTGQCTREELRVAEAILPFLLLPPMEWKSYKSGAQNTPADREPQPVDPLAPALYHCSLSVG